MNAHAETTHAIAETIAAFRGTKDWTQETLAHELGVTVSTVNRWENGVSRPSRLARVALASLGCALPLPAYAASRPTLPDVPRV